jgi:hypothetical protein
MSSYGTPFSHYLASPLVSESTSANLSIGKRLLITIQYGSFINHYFLHCIKNSSFFTIRINRACFMLNAKGKKGDTIELEMQNLSHLPD